MAVLTRGERKRFCRFCGAKLVPEETGFYNVETGEKEARLVCPKKPCGHSGCEYTLGKCIRCKRVAYVADW